MVLVGDNFFEGLQVVFGSVVVWSEVSRKGGFLGFVGFFEGFESFFGGFVGFFEGFESFFGGL